MPPLRNELELLHHLHAVLRRRWETLVAGLVVGIAGSLLYAANQTSIYAATTEISIGDEPWRAVVGTELLSSAYGQQLTFDTQPYILQTRPVLERAAAAVPSEKVTVEQLRRRLSVKKVPGTRVLQITVESTTPDGAQGLSRAVADAYVSLTKEKRDESAWESIRWLEQQIVDYEAKVQQSHEAMIDYVEKQNLTQFGSTPKQDESASGIEMLLDRLRQEKIGAELEVDRMNQRYGPKHPDLIHMRSEVSRLSSKIAEVEQTQRASQKKTIGYDILAGKARADMELYGVLARKLEQANISGTLASDLISIVQYAERPTRPIRPNRVRIALLGSLAGLLVGIGMCFLRETLDQRIQTVAQVTQLASHPVLGSVPDVGDALEYRENGALQIFSRTATAGSEALRGLRANVKFSLVGLEPRILLVTSSKPGEGKTMITANLGTALAGAGLKVLLVDGDLRRPALHRHFGLKSPPAGLSTVIAGNADDVDSARIRGRDGGPDLLPAGPSPPNPGDFLESARLAGLLRRMSDEYDVVLVDSPPGDLFADAQVLGRLAGGVVVVVRVKLAERTGVSRLLARLHQGGCKIVGYAINGVEPTEIAYYKEAGRYGAAASAASPAEGRGAAGPGGAVIGEPEPIAKDGTHG